MVYFNTREHVLNLNQLKFSMTKNYQESQQVIMYDRDINMIMYVPPEAILLKEIKGKQRGSKDFLFLWPKSALLR